MKHKIRLFIVDDSELFCEAISDSLENFGTFIVKGYSLTGESSLRKLRRIHRYVDIVLLEARLPDMTGEDFVYALKKLNSNLKTVLLTKEISPAIIQQALACGMSGVLSKKNSLRVFFKSIVDIHYGETIVHTLAEDIHRPKRIFKQLHTTVFTKRELEIIQNIAKGKKTREIAQSLFISYKTVENHRSNILQKSGASNMIELINFLIKKDYI